MAYALVLNPGSNSLKFEVVEFTPGSRLASGGRKLASATLDDVGKAAKLSIFHDRKVVHTEPREAADMQAAVREAVAWLRSQHELAPVLQELVFAGVRVVHGGPSYAAATVVSPQVRAEIERLEEIAPLHNKSSLAVLDVLDRELPGVRQMVAFDTAFHRTLPEVAWRYPIDRELADRFGVRKYGFHGLSHRYMLEQYAATVGKRPEEVTIVTLHLESGCSACAIAKGSSVDTTMGLTPLEGLMMGSRSGSIDPGILPYLMKQQGVGIDEVMTTLNKHSGMLGIAGGTLDTRELVKRDDKPARLALEMFSYRVRLAVGAYLAALGDAEAVLFGGGIGEDSPWLRAAVCPGLRGWGLALDEEANRSIEGQVKISTPASKLEAWAMPVEEGLQLGLECMQALQAAGEPV